MFSELPFLLSGQAMAASNPLETGEPVDALPLSVGLVGKRIFSRDDEEDARIGARVLRSVEAVFETIEAHSRDCPKLLICGGARGSDLIAAREALNRGWLVCLVLPFAQEAYFEDFSEADRKAFEEVAAHAGARVQILSGLGEPFGRVTAAAKVSKQGASEAERVRRRQHHAQVGCWIAENCDLLLAVIGEETCGPALGGAVLSLAYRLGVDAEMAGVENARPADVDTARAMRSMLEESVELVDTSPLLPFGRPAIVIRFDRPKGDRTEVKSRWLRKDGETVKAECFFRSDGARVLNFPCRLVRDMQPLERSSTTAGRWPHNGEPADVLLGLRNDARGRRLGTKKAYASSLMRLTLLFLVAVGCFELYGNLLNRDNYALWLYLGAYLAVMGAYAFARRKGWQPRSEDCRAVAEALRVQIAWMRAGLSERVDRDYMTTSSTDIAHIRGCIRSALLWARLSCSGAQAREDWSDVWKAPRASNREKRRDWIGVQRDFFKENSSETRVSARGWDQLSWALFLAAGFVGGLLVLDITFFGVSGGLAVVVGTWSPGCRYGDAPSIVLVLFGALAGLGRLAYSCRFVATRPSLLLPIGCLMAIALIAIVVLCVGAFLAPATEGAAEIAVKTYLATAAVLVSALAGAMRFRAEKLGFEALMRDYEIAFGLFVRADTLFASEPAIVGTSEGRRLVRELGLLALRENEGWLKARRERALSPLF